MSSGHAFLNDVNQMFSVAAQLMSMVDGLTAVIGTLLLAGGENNPMDALRNAMIIGALPFTMVLGLMCVALAKALYRDRLSDKATAEN